MKTDKVEIKVSKAAMKGYFSAVAHREYRPGRLSYLSESLKSCPYHAAACALRNAGYCNDPRFPGAWLRRNRTNTDWVKAEICFFVF